MVLAQGVGRLSPICVSCDPVSVFDLAGFSFLGARSHENLPNFIPQNVEEVVAKSGNHEMRGGNSSSAKTNL